MAASTRPFDIVVSAVSFRMQYESSATRYSYDPVIPLSALHAQIPFARTFTQAEYDVVSRGLIPAGMDDRWFIFRENDQLYFHRSWTGVCVYQITVEHTADMFVVTEALVNRDPAEYRIADDAFDIALLSFLIDNLLLGRPAKLPSRSNTSAGQ